MLALILITFLVILPMCAIGFIWFIEAEDKLWKKLEAYVKSLLGGV